MTLVTSAVEPPSWLRRCNRQQERYPPGRERRFAGHLPADDLVAPLRCPALLTVGRQAQSWSPSG